jgi:hypothetical protein
LNRDRPLSDKSGDALKWADLPTTGAWATA